MPGRARWSHVVLLFALSIAWASDYIFIARADRALPPLTVAASTTLLAGFVMLVAVGGVLRRPLWPMLRRNVRVVLVLSVLAIALPKLAIVVADRSVSPDLSSLVGVTVPLVTVLLSTFVTRQMPFSWRRMLGFVVALLGLLAFIGLDGDLSGDRAAEAGQLHGALVQMAGGVIFALSGIYASLRAKNLDQYALITWMLLSSGIGLSVAALVVDGAPPPLSVAVTASLLGSGVVSMAFAYLVYYLLIERAGASFASYYAFLLPPLGLATGILLYGETLTAGHVIGILVTLVGLWLLTRLPPGARESP